ncbi:MAG TPA: cellulase family glycosylhydrolase [Candidatus Lokiarchaeia archaeon]|nr:cellulase family glycosylhydrolase [Candidatus Lokiarchaeia archaeon]
MTLTIKDGAFVDDEGRSVLLRGVNLGGNCKYPARPCSPTNVKTDFHDHREVSYVGAPFPLEEANEHFERLKHWGFNALRFLVSWEGIEHAGPGDYDTEYLDYVKDVLDIATNHGFYTFIDPHQDVWGRMSGGDGAPGWTYEAVGLDFTKFDAAEAALVMQYRYDPANPATYPPLNWSENSIRFAPCTMFTLFFGGNDFAPSCMIEGVSAQDYLQQHFIDAVKQLASRVQDNNNVLGFAAGNEPPQGWIEINVDGSNFKGLNEILGYSFKPIDAMATAAGIPRTVGYREIKKFGIKETRKDELNPGRVSAWLPGKDDIWQKEGVWKVDQDGDAVIVKNDHFTNVNGKDVDFYRDYLSSFIVKFTTDIRAIIPDTCIFFEGNPEKMLKGEPLNFQFPDDIEGLVFAPHWYDSATLGLKKPMLMASFDMMTNRPILGKGNIADMFVKHLAKIKETGASIRPGMPTILAEMGLPYDLNNKEAYEKCEAEGEKAWEKHIECLSLYYDAIDANLLSSLQWNYTATNTNEFGDGWNLEDMSIFSFSQRSDPGSIDSGGRAVTGFCRPHFISCAGTPTSMSFDVDKGKFSFTFDASTAIDAPTVIFVPTIQYPDDYDVKVSQSNAEISRDEQLVSIRATSDDKCSVIITRKK